MKSILIFKYLIGFGLYLILLLFNVFKFISEFIRGREEKLFKNKWLYELLLILSYFIEEIFEKCRKVGYGYNGYYVKDKRKND